jgi:DNA-binding transcriptional MerR regulator
MKIGELAARTGTSTKTLRFYEDAGLLREPARTPSGYRDYDDGASLRVQFIRTGQGLGLTLAEIRTLMEIRDDGRAPCAAATELLDIQLADIAARIAGLRTMQRELGQLRDLARHLDDSDCAPDSVCHIINPGPCKCHGHQPIDRA